MRWRLLRLWVACCVFSSMAFCDVLENENLLYNLPKNYKVGFQTKKNGMVMTELIPQQESINQWTEMVTAQIFLGLKTLSPEQFQTRMETLWSKACPNAQFATVTQGEENGYAFLIWMQMCPLNQTTGKPENTWFKAIKGNDSFYVVQKAFTYDPSKEEVVTWMHYFQSVKVCDTRRAESPCPSVK